MKICLISQEYPPETNFGGIATYTQVLARSLARMGVIVHVISRTKGPRYHTYETGIKIHRIPELPIGISLKRTSNSSTKQRSNRSLKSCISFINKVVFRGRMFNQFGRFHHILYFSQQVYKELQRIDAEGPIDVVEAPETCAQAIIAYKHMKRIKTVTRLHTPYFWVRHINNMKDVSFHTRRDILERKQVEYSNAITSPSYAMARIVREKWGVNDIHVIPNFIDLDDYIPNWSIYDEKLRGSDYILFFGRIEKRKGVHILAEALPTILKRYHWIKAVFVGDPSPHGGEEIKAYISQNLDDFKERIQMMPNIPRNSLYPIIKKAKLVVLPSIWENFPYACLESMALGKSVIATKGSGFSEIINDGFNGFLCEKNSSEALAEKIKYCMDLDNMNVIERRASNRAQEFRTRKIVDEMLLFYKKL